MALLGRAWYISWSTAHLLHCYRNIYADQINFPNVPPKEVLDYRPTARRSLRMLKR